MKKIISLVLILICLFSLTACPDSEEKYDRLTPIELDTNTYTETSKLETSNTRIKYTIIFEKDTSTQMAKKMEIEITLFDKNNRFVCNEDSIIIDNFKPDTRYTYYFDTTINTTATYAKLTKYHYYIIHIE